MSIEYTTSNTIYTSGTLDYNDSSGTTTLTYCDNTTGGPISCDWYTVWPTHYYHWCGDGYRTSKLEKAFKIVQMLMEEKIVKLTSVKKFVALVNKVSEVI